MNNLFRGANELKCTIINIDQKYIKTFYFKSFVSLFFVFSSSITDPTDKISQNNYLISEEAEANQNCLLNLIYIQSTRHVDNYK